MLKNKLFAMAMISLMIASSVAMASATLPQGSDPTAQNNFALSSYTIPPVGSGIHSNFELRFYNGENVVSNHALSLDSTSSSNTVWVCYFNNNKYTDDEGKVINVPDGATSYALYNQQTKLSTGKIPIDQKVTVDFMDISQGKTIKSFSSEYPGNALKIVPRLPRGVMPMDNSHEWKVDSHGSVYYDVVA
ncbi:MAG: hypothetical protein LBR15_10255 [Methanobrevibacter sp.]|jgi:hypothetical protein|nr:hypothetical protein [Candidatus Methanovirga australis]